MLAALVVYGTYRIARIADGRLQRKIGRIGIKNYELVRQERVRDVFRGLLRGVAGLVLLAITLAFLSYSLGQFPWTRGTSAGLVSLVVGPLQTMAQGVVRQIPNLIFLAIFFVVVRFILRMTRLLFEGIGRGFVTFANFEPEWAAPTYKIARLAIVAFAIVVAYPYVPGSDSDAFKGVSLFVGVLLSLGSSSAIANVIAGYSLTYRRAFKIGDRVKIGGLVGDVTDQKLQVTRLRSPKNEEFVIPNSQILNGDVVNYSTLAHTHGLILHTDVGIGYETPWRQVEAMLLMAADATPGMLREPRPFVLQKALGDFAVTYELNVVLRQPACDGGALHRASSPGARRLQPVRRPDHDAGVRGRSGDAQGGSARSLAPCARRGGRVGVGDARRARPGLVGAAGLTRTMKMSRPQGAGARPADVTVCCYRALGEWQQRHDGWPRCDAKRMFSGI